MNSKLPWIFVIAALFVATPHAESPQKAAGQTVAVADLPAAVTASIAKT